MMTEFIALGNNISSNSSKLDLNNVVAGSNSSNVTDPQSINVLTIVEMTGEVLIAILAIFGNGLVLLAIASVPSLQTVTNYYVASLAAADLLVGLLGIPCVIVAFNGLPTNFVGCLIVNSCIIVLTQISIFGLLVVAFERFYAIRYPYYYYHYCTPKTSVVAIILTWIAGIVVGMVPIFGWNSDKMAAFEAGTDCQFTGVIDMEYMVYMNFFGFVLPPLIAMFIIYGYIYTVVRKQIRKIFTLQLSSAIAAAAAGGGGGGRGGGGATSDRSCSCLPPPCGTVSNGVLENGDVDGSNDFQMKVMARSKGSTSSSSSKKENGYASGNNSTVSGRSSCSEGKNDSAREPDDVKNAEVPPGERKTSPVAADDVTQQNPTKSETNALVNSVQNGKPEGKDTAKATPSSDSNSAAARKSASNWKKEIRAAKWFAVVLFVFTACWLPLHIMNCVTVFADSTCYVCVTLAVLLSHLNSGVNPILYAYSNSKFATAFRRMLRLSSNSSPGNCNELTTDGRDRFALR